MAIACVPDFPWARAICPTIKVIVSNSPYVGDFTRPLLFATATATRHVQCNFPASCIQGLCHLAVLLLTMKVRN